MIGARMHLASRRVVQHAIVDCVAFLLRFYVFMYLYDFFSGFVVVVGVVLNSPTCRLFIDGNSVPTASATFHGYMYTQYRMLAVLG